MQELWRRCPVWCCGTGWVPAAAAASYVTDYLFTQVICFVPSVLWHCWLGGTKGIRPVKNWVVGVGMVICLERCADFCIWPSWCHCHSLSLASVKSRLVLPFWYQLTWVITEKGPLKGCVCVCVIDCVHYSLTIRWSGLVCRRPCSAMLLLQTMSSLPMSVTFFICRTSADTSGRGTRQYRYWRTSLGPIESTAPNTLLCRTPTLGQLSLASLRGRLFEYQLRLG